MDIEKLKEFFNSIPMEELSDEIKKHTGLSDLTFKTTILDVGHRLSILYKSQDIVDKAGFLKLIFRELYVQANGMVAVNRDEELEYWCIVEMDYYHPGGRHESCIFLHARYTDKTGWNFEESYGI